MLRSLWITSIIAAALTDASPCADAQTAQAPEARKSPPTKKELDEARGHFKAAEGAKARGDYQTAAVEYLAAYERFAEPEFFFDVAEVYRLAGDEPNALTYYDKYLELDPNGRGATSARSSADQLRRSIAAKQDADRRKVDDERKRIADEQARRTAARRVVEGPTAPGRSLRIAGIATGGPGVVALGIGVVFGFKARSISNEISNASNYDPQRYKDGKAAERNLFIFTGIGGAAVIAGGIFYYLGHRTGQTADSHAVTVAPIAGPSQIVVSATSRF